MLRIAFDDLRPGVRGNVAVGRNVRDAHLHEGAIGRELLTAEMVTHDLIMEYGPSALILNPNTASLEFLLSPIGASSSTSDRGRISATMRNGPLHSIKP
jgi:hypothetical protein